MRFDVLTLFPEIFQGYLTQSLLKLALDKGLVEIHLWNIRDWAKGKHKSVDDRPFGGGPRVFRGMEVPDILLSGNHPAIARWRQKQSTARSRPSEQPTTSEGESNEK